jgi:beta-glucosidase-like glycosyl hydrolase
MHRKMTRGKRPQANDWVERTLAGLTPEQKTGQLLNVCFFGLDLNSLPGVLERMKRFHLGGYFQVKNTLKNLRDCNEVIQREVEVPMLVASDFEAGVGYMLEGGTLFPRQMARGHANDAKAEYEIGRITAVEGRAAGIHMTAAPVFDIHVNPAYPDGNTRAWGDDPAVITKLGVANVRGLQEHGMAALAKHFPGSGSTEMDQHMAAAWIPESRERMSRLYHRPYAEAIRHADLLGVMVSHLDVPSLITERHPVDGLPVPASLSKEIVTGILKKKLGFRGMTMTDAFNMGGVNNRYTRGEAALKAIQAGNDNILCFDPGTLEQEYEAIRKGARDGPIPAARLDDAVRRVLTVKQKLGLDRDRGIPLPEDRYREAVTPLRHEAFTRRVTDRAVTVLRNDRKRLPLKGMAGKKALVISAFNPDRELAVRKGHKPYDDAVPTLLRARGLIVNEIEIVPDFGDDAKAKLQAAIEASDILFLDIFGIPSYGIGTILPHRAVMELFYRGILNCGKPVVVSLFGDPFIARYAPSAEMLVLTFDETCFSQASAVAVIFGEIPAKGRTPVAIPPWFPRGSGLKL